MNEKSQQIAVVENQPPLHTAFSIEIAEPVAKKLRQICTEQNIPVRNLTSELLKRMLLDHRKETKEIVAKFKDTFWNGQGGETKWQT